MPGLKVPFGLKNGRLVGTDEVERGLACACICPECGAILEAHKGEQVAHHFAHHVVGNCAYGLESALHLGAKQILLEEQLFAVPALEAFARVTDPDTGLSGEARKMLPDKLVQFAEVRQEVDLGGVVADIYASYRNYPIIIEIAVTHFCDDEKIRRLEQLGLPAVELDLSRIAPPITMAELRAWVVERLEHKTWLFNPRMAALQEAAEAEAGAALTQALAAETKWSPNKSSWDKKYKTWSCSEKLEYALQRLRLAEAEIPSYLNYTTRGDRAILCDRRVWQSALFANFIHRKVVPLNITLGYMAEWLTDGFDVKEPFPNALKVALWDFLGNLEHVGCLERVHGQEYYIRRNSIKDINVVVEGLSQRGAQDSQRAVEGRKIRIEEAWRLPLDRDLIWVAKWNDTFAQDALAECERAFGAHPAWASLLTTLSPDAKALQPSDFALRHANTTGLSPDRVLRALVLAGFVIELPF